jgi:hypothetical protein
VRRGQGKQKLDSLKSVDLRYLHRNGLLKHGRVSTIWWIRKGKEKVSVTVIAAEDHILLNYLIQRNEVTEFVELTRMECHLGGTRPFMKCPHCDRQVLLLYLSPACFRCRHCWRLTYASRNEGKLDLQFRRVWRAREKLGAPADLTALITPRAKWKHRSKYERLRKEAELQQQKVFGLLNKKLQVLKGELL